MNKLEIIENKMTFSEKKAIKLQSEKELNTFRILFLVTVIGYPIFGAFNTFVHFSEDISIFFQRCLFATLIVICLILSYKVKFVKEKFYYIISFFTYLGIAHLAYIATITGYNFNHSLGMIVVLIGTSFVYRRLKHLRYYLIYCSITVTISALLAPKNQLDTYIVIGLFNIICLIIFFALHLINKSQKKIQGNEANIHALIENAEGIIWSIDLKFNYIAFNKSYETLINKITRKTPLIGQTIKKTNLNSKLSSLFLDAYSKVFCGENVNFIEEIIIQNETKIFSFSMRPIKIEYTRIIGVTVFGNDITKEKKYEADLIKSKELAEYLTLSKEKFMANMSHEIRTPLNGIIGFTKVLLQSKNLNEEQKKQLNAIKSCGDILLVVINDILDLSKIEAGKMNLESTVIDIDSISKLAIGAFEMRIKEKKLNVNLTVSKDIPPSLLGDPVRISQILLNIINNAIKFTPNNGNISVDVTKINESDETTTIQFEIEDSGIGIQANKLNLIFEPFVQTNDDTTRKYGGTGLGLSIVKNIVDLMKGSIKVSSKFGERTKFTIQIPFKNSNFKSIESKEILIQANNSFHPEKIKILLADDNLINQYLAQTVLKQFGFEITTVDNGKMALETFINSDFDIILMDLMMPVMDGFQATIAIRSLNDVTKRTIPIIALTADVTNEDIERCKQTGMNEFISKPFEPNDLFNKIASLLENKNEK